MNTAKQMEPKNILVIDNYDSFTFNLVHLINECGHQATVWRNDKFDLKDVAAFDYILLSPGPGIPQEAGLLLEVIRTYGDSKRILGICLGQQAIAEVYGAALYNLSRPVHGVAMPLLVKVPSEPLFEDVPEKFLVGRYHSWAVSKTGFPDDALQITGEDEAGVIMSISHRSFAVKGVQFHPESILTEHGKQLITNWINS